MFPSDIQRAIQKRLQDTPYFGDAPAIPVIARCQGDVIRAVMEAVGKAGIAVIVMPGEGSFIRHETPAPNLDGEFRIRVEENVSVNRSAMGTNEPAEEVAWAAAQRLLQWIPLHAETGAQLAGGGFVLGKWSAEESSDKGGNAYFSAEFTVRIRGGDSAGLYGENLIRGGN